MRLTITDRLVARTAQEGSSVAFAVKCWDDASEPWTASAPSTLRYRLDNPDTGEVLADWTTVTPAVTATVTTTGTHNAIDADECRERRQLTVQANAGLSTAEVATREYFVRGLAGV